MSCPSYFIPHFSTVQVGQLVMYWGLELNVETTRHGSNSCLCKITLETTRVEASHAEATHEEVTHHSTQNVIGGTKRQSTLFDKSFRYLSPTCLYHKPFCYCYCKVEMHECFVINFVEKDDFVTTVGD